MKKYLFLLAASTLLLAGCTSTSAPQGYSNLDQFAQCLTQAQVKMYGTTTCSHCLDQKAMFGDSFKYIDYVDCLATPNLCSKIEGTPTWKLADETLLLGKQELAVLAQKTNCELTPITSSK